MKIHRTALFATATVALLLTGLACDRKPSPEAVAAQDAAKAADARVAALEKELADVKSGKHTQGHPDHEHLSKSEQKALERQLIEAKQHADEKKKEALDLAKAPVASAPKLVTVDVPAGTKLEVKLAKDLSTESAQPGDAWEGVLVAPVTTADGRTVWPAGTPVHGVVSQSAAAGRLSGGQGGLGIRLMSVGREDVDTGTYVVVGTARGERNAKIIGGTAALGALVGILSDKKHQADHALGGAAIGAATGTALAAGTADTAIRIPAAKPVTFTLTAPERVTLKP